MKPSEACKLQGFKSLREVSQLSGWSETWLLDKHKNNPEMFQVALNKAKEARDASRAKV